jgi:hypothetical protein
MREYQKIECEGVNKFLNLIEREHYYLSYIL